MKKLKGIAHNIAHQFFSGLWYWNGGFMEDWIFNAARELDIHFVTLNVSTGTVEPIQMTLKSLEGGLKMSKNSLKRLLEGYGLEENYIKTAKMEVTIPDFQKRLLIVKSSLERQDGKIYTYDNFYASATNINFDPFVQETERDSVPNRVHRLVMKIRHFLTKDIR